MSNVRFMENYSIFFYFSEYLYTSKNCIHKKLLRYLNFEYFNWTQNCITCYIFENLNVIENFRNFIIPQFTILWTQSSLNQRFSFLYYLIEIKNNLNKIFYFIRLFFLKVYFSHHSRYIISKEIFLMILFLRLLNLQIILICTRFKNSWYLLLV